MISICQRWPGAAFVVLAAIGLGGCVETTAELAPGADAQHLHLARRPGVSLAGATVAFVSVDGPPADVSANFMKELARDAAAQDIVVADAKKARYFVRGYLSAYPTQDGAAVEYVWDIFTKDRARAQRLSDYLVVKGEGSDPWAVAGAGALASVAAKSADDLAAFLSNTPEAVAGATIAPGTTAAVEKASGALAYAK
ncbi:MAG TPA: hypothetical protein VKU03_09885 [Roseiarcus sp.]|nr:hypothetical protein [Roseiarcus sp.]